MPAERKRLGELLVEEQIVTEEQLGEALRHQLETGELLGRTIAKLGFTDGATLQSALARHFAKLPITLADCGINPDITSLLPGAMAREHLAVPVGANPDRVIVAMANPMDTRAVQALAARLGRQVWPVMCPRTTLVRALATHYGPEEGEEEEVPDVVTPTALFPQPPSEFTFESLVVGDANRVAYLTAETAANFPGTTHNPLLIHGDVGRGKTHLLCAIGNRAVERDRSRYVGWLAARDLERELMDAIESNRVGLFHAKYQRADVLLLDDIHFLARGRGVQEEVVRLFSFLCSRGKQIAVTSDRPLKELDVLAEEIRSQFSSGAAVEVKTSSPAVKAAILLAKQKVCGTRLPDEIVVDLAQLLPDDIRQLEGTLRNLAVRLAMSDESPTVENMKAILQQMGLASA